MMKVCIVGAGAIGGYLGVKLALAGAEVSLIARGAHLQAIQTQGLKLVMGDGSHTVIHPTLATDDICQAGPQDLVIIGLKTQSVPLVAADLPSLYGANTIVLPAQNGIPWWYFRQHGGPYEGTRLQMVDPEGIVEGNMGVERVIGCVVYPAAEVIAPGVIQHIEGDRFSLGELDGRTTERLQGLAELFKAAGLKAPIRTQIRTDIWVKLWGNLAFNPISALTHATLAQICEFPPTRDLAAQMMAEAQTIAEKLGIRFGITLEQRIAGAEKVGAHKTSMLQDIEAGRRTEIDALVGSVVELGRLTHTPTPHIDAVYASVKLLENTCATPPTH
jgi:2-dehydropantoate 2-reductase